MVAWATPIMPISPFNFKIKCMPIPSYMPWLTIRQTKMNRWILTLYLQGSRWILQTAAQCTGKPMWNCGYFCHKSVAIPHCSCRPVIPLFLGVATLPPLAKMQECTVHQFKYGASVQVRKDIKERHERGTVLARTHPHTHTHTKRKEHSVRQKRQEQNTISKRNRSLQNSN